MLVVSNPDDFRSSKSTNLTISEALNIGLGEILHFFSAEKFTI